MARARRSNLPTTTTTTKQEDEDDKPTPTFGTALTKYAFPSPRVTRSSSAAATATATAPSKKRALPPPASSKKKRTRHAGYAPPSKYSHLSGIPDTLSQNLILLFIGLNPGLCTAATGHAYSSPTNHFWRLLHRSGLTPDRQRLPTDDVKLPELYSFGNTNLVSRPTKDQAELSLDEMEASVPIVEEKVRTYRPEAVCIVGKGIWERIYRVKAGRKLKEFQFGWQDEWRMGAVDGEWEGARVFVSVSTSGLVAGYSPARKLEIMTELGDWVNKRRGERGETAPRGLPDEVVEKAGREREEEHRRNLANMQAAIKAEEEELDVKVEGSENGVTVKIKVEVEVEGEI